MEIYKIHTLPILRNEIKMYTLMKEERKKTIDGYRNAIKEYDLQLYELSEQMLAIKSPGGDGLGGFVSDSDSKFNSLIQKKEDIDKARSEYIQLDRTCAINSVAYWDKRIATVEHYLYKLEEKDLEFIKDLYVDNIGIQRVMKKYYIDYKNNVYRKADKILRKVL